jgi:hypothetical protein
MLPDSASPSFYTDISDCILGYAPDIFLCGELSDNEEIIIGEPLREYTSVCSDNGSAFVQNNVTVSKISEYKESGVLCEAYAAVCGELEFVLIYVSGRAEGEIEVDIDALVGESALPVIVMSYIDDPTKVSFKGGAYIEKVAQKRGKIYGKDAVYTCYADTRGLLVVEDSWKNDYGFCAIKVSLS